MQVLLQQRLASCGQASCSYPAAAAATAAAAAAARQQPARHRVRDRASSSQQQSWTARSRSSRHTWCRATADDDSSPEAADLMALDPSNDTVYDRMSFASNRTPDYEDPHWVEQVEDWEDFWYNPEDDELDTEEGLSTAARSEQSLERARLLVSQLGDLRKRADVVQMITGEIRPEPFYEDTYRTEDEMVMDHNFYGPDPNPIYDAVDLRALAEKRAARAALDAEWKRQESLLAKPYSYTLSQRLGNDARLQSAEFDWIREEWTHEQIMDMIVGGGKFVHPDQVKVRVLNPLLPMDFHNDVRSHVIPETEEFIASIGHMASEEDILYLQSAQEIKLHSKDFVDSTVMFQDTEGGTYVDAPPNPWAEKKRIEDAEDLIMFDQMVEKVASKQRQREEAAAAREAGLMEGELQLEEEEAGPPGDDDIMGDGFTNFIAQDEDNEAGVLFYEDELDGDFSESAFLDRDEAEEEDDDDEEADGQQAAGEEGS